jgi:hypothetical protein
MLKCTKSNPIYIQIDLTAYEAEALQSFIELMIMITTKAYHRI